MEKKNKRLSCIVGLRVRDVIDEANKRGVKREDLVSIFAKGEQTYLVFYE